MSSETNLHSTSAIGYVRRPRTDSGIHARSRNVEHLVSEVVLVQVLGLQDVLNGQRDERTTLITIRDTCFTSLIFNVPCL